MNNSAPHRIRNQPQDPITDHASRITFHAPRITPHASGLTFHESRFTPHASRFTCLLDLIQNWPELAHESGYSVAAFARICGVSVRVLERFFQAAIGCKPSHWLNNLRMQRAAELLRDGCNVNETADRLGYNDHSHFSREFKKYYGLTPKNYAGNPLKAPPKHALSHSATNLSRLDTHL